MTEEKKSISNEIAIRIKFLSPNNIFGKEKQAFESGVVLIETNNYKEIQAKTVPFNSIETLSGKIKQALEESGISLVDIKK